MNSPLVARLTSAIAECKQFEERAALQAELACYWARVGEFDAAEALKREVRQRFGDGSSVRVSILLMCLDSLLLYYRELSLEARDRMQRANLLSKSFGQRQLTSFTSAWMAHIDFNQNRFQQMDEGLRACFDTLDAEDAATDSRVSLVLGDAFLVLGDFTSSRNWYDRARRSANKLGDHAAIGAFTYNQGALLVTAVRLKSLTMSIDETELASVRSAVNSAINYQATARLRSLDHLLVSSEVGVLMLQRSYASAESKIRLLLSSNEVSPRSGQLLLLQADLAQALAGTGRTDEAIAKVRSLDPGAFNAQPDDRALAASQLSDVAKTCGDDRARASWNMVANEALQRHGQLVEALRPCLSEYVDASRHQAK